jgi:dTDP-4-dehydrorhamnose reductase
LGSTVDEQMCWFKEIWDGACKAREHGIDVRAVTVWALFGLYDWDSLVTQNRGRYEPGAFDLSSGSLEATRYAHMIRALAKNERRFPETLKSKGWWRQEGRILYEV